MIEAMFSTEAFFALIGISQEAAFWAVAVVAFVLFVTLVTGSAIYFARDEQHAVTSEASTPTAIGVVVGLGLFLLALILAGCGGSHSDTQRDSQGNAVIDQPKEKAQ
jgi:uncharacterized membrane protein (DUF485 family)